MKFNPVIKWSGSKRSQSEVIVSNFPKKITIYYEPFVGGGSVLYQLLNSDIKVESFICSDINEDLIKLWNIIKDKPLELSAHYKMLWEELNKDENIERRKKYYNLIRDRFNKERNPMDFLFISRTTTNGLIRYNKKGEFNNSFHFTRKGINPTSLENIILEWSNLLNKNNVLFFHQSYENITSNNGDLIYLDPPYANTKGMYYGGIDLEKFFNWLSIQKGNYVLSFDGKSEELDNTYNVPCNLYSKHIYINSGLSSFRKLHNSNINVYESLYLK